MHITFVPVKLPESVEGERTLEARSVFLKKCVLALVPVADVPSLRLYAAVCQTVARRLALLPLDTAADCHSVPLRASRRSSLRRRSTSLPLLGNAAVAAAAAAEAATPPCSGPSCSRAASMPPLPRCGGGTSNKTVASEQPAASAGSTDHVEMSLQVAGVASDVVSMLCSSPVVRAVAGPICPVAGAVGLGLSLKQLSEGWSTPGEDGEKLLLKGATSSAFGALGLGFCIGSMACPPLLIGSITVCVLDMGIRIYLEDSWQFVQHRWLTLW